MKRNLALLLASLLLVFTLTACGGDKKANDDAGDNNAVVNGDTANGDNADGDTVLGNDTGNNETNGNDLMDDAKNDLDNMGDDIRDGVDDAIDDVLPGDSAGDNNTASAAKQANRTGGVTYGQMMRNSQSRSGGNLPARDSTDIFARYY